VSSFTSGQAFSGSILGSFMGVGYSWRGRQVNY
jgi:hypothetical protein